MKKTLVLLFVALTFGHQVHAAKLMTCPGEQNEVARCSLSEFKYEGSEEVGHSPFPVEAILCGRSTSANKLQFIYRVSNEAPLTQKFVKVQNQYISPNPSENIQLVVEPTNSQVKIIEYLEGKQITSLYTCILW
jgi:hypothetical protein